MGIFENKNHFLHKHLTEIHSIQVEGKNEGFQNFLTRLEINNSGENWNEDHSQVDWNKMEIHYQFFFDYLNNEIEIRNWLKTSQLSKYEYVFTWLS
jgi:hypothetical protein